jgi:hypothetical protein
MVSKVVLQAIMRNKNKIAVVKLLKEMTETMKTSTTYLVSLKWSCISHIDYSPIIKKISNVSSEFDIAIVSTKPLDAIITFPCTKEAVEQTAPEDNETILPDAFGYIKDILVPSWLNGALSGSKVKLKDSKVLSNVAKVLKDANMEVDVIMGVLQHMLDNKYDAVISFFIQRSPDNPVNHPIKMQQETSVFMYQGGTIGFYKKNEPIKIAQIPSSSGYESLGTRGWIITPVFVVIQGPNNTYTLLKRHSREELSSIALYLTNEYVTVPFEIYPTVTAATSALASFKHLQ